jgi:anti-sigma B factor antagonist
MTGICPRRRSGLWWVFFAAHRPSWLAGAEQWQTDCRKATLLRDGEPRSFRQRPRRAAGFVPQRISDPSEVFVGMPTHQRIDVSKVGDVTVVRFNDRKILDEAKIIQFGTELFGLVDLDNRKSILLNFDGVEFLSSAALGKLITLDRKVKSHKGRLKMSNIRREIYDVFQVTKLNKVFDIHDGEAEAISAF